jgi:hypothetical protein
MDPVFAFIDQNGNRRIRSGVGNMLCHLLHDQGITDYEPHYLRFVESRLLSENSPMIKFQEQHQMRFAHVAINHFFQFSEGARRLGCTGKRGKIQSADTSFQ